MSDERKGGPRRKSKHLRVLVSEGNRTRVDVTLAAAATEYLLDLLPETITSIITARGLDVERIRRDAIASGLEPGELFTLEDDGRRVRVWLQ
jgi:hypothetical protein